METRIVVTPHAIQRCEERGGDPRSIADAAEQSANRIVSAAACRNRRVAMKSPDLPVIPVIEVSPRRNRIVLVVVTVLPQSARVPHPVIVA